MNGIGQLYKYKVRTIAKPYQSLQLKVLCNHLRLELLLYWNDIYCYIESLNGNAKKAL